MYNIIKEFARDESGATAIEYGMIAAVISVGVIVAVTNLGDAIIDLFRDESTRLDGIDP